MVRNRKNLGLGQGGLLCFFALLGALTVSLQANSETYRQAYDAGYVDGMRAGKQDKESGQAFDFANKRIYQSADQGWDPARHDRDVYAVAYRRGFEDGYEVGYGLARRRSTQPDPLRGESSPLSMGGIASLPRQAAELPEGSLLRLRLIDSLSTQRNERGDRFRAELLEDFRIDEAVVIPKGTLFSGRLGHVKRAGRIAGRAEMNLRFEMIDFGDGTTVPVEAILVGVDERAQETIDEREGSLEAPGTRSEDARKIGATSAIGALIGLISNRKTGAGIGAAVGAGAGLGGVLATRGREIELGPNTELTIKLTRELSLSGR